MQPEERRKLVWLDLCCGLKGASQPAIDRGWKVICVDIDPRFKPDIVADVRALPFRPYRGTLWIEHRRVDVLWASPPCTEFSKFGLRCFYPNPPEPDLSIVRAIKETLRTFSPRFWCVENVWASRPWLTKIFGPVRARPPGHAIWSNLAFLLPHIEPHKGKVAGNKRWGPMGHGNDSTNAEWWRKRGKSYVGTGHNGTNAAEAARIPYEIGEAICRAVEQRQEAVA